MKHLFTAVILLLIGTRLVAQSDTLHIYYLGLATKIVDSNDTKIGKWAKSLNGKKVDVQVLAYYNDKNFKQYSQERVDELYLILNRKARELINITSMAPVRGEKSQRSTVDIVYTRQGQAPVKATPEPKAEKAVTKTEKTEKPEKASKSEKAEKQEVTKSGKDKKSPTPESTQPSGQKENSGGGADEPNSAPTTEVKEGEPLRVMVNGEWVEYQNGKKVKKKK